MKIIIFTISGIGTAILFTPTLIEIRKNFNKDEIVLLAKNKTIADIISGSNYVNKIIIFNKYNFFNKIKLLLKLRKQKFDYSITTFPSNKFQFNLFAFIIGAKKRITHKYKVGKIKTFPFLQNIKIIADEKLHDVEQNLNLLKGLGIKKKDFKKKVFFYISKEDKKFADNFFNKNRLNNYKIIGIHPGCKKEDKLRRWPEKRFIKLINKLNLNKKIKILLFSGPDERDTIKKIYKKLRVKPFIIESKEIKKIGAIINKCNIFLSTDSGLGHIAAALETPVIAIFGPANYNRTRPYGKRCYVIHSNLKKPLLKYPFESTSCRLNTKKTKESLRKISTKEVLKKINSLLTQK